MKHQRLRIFPAHVFDALTNAPAPRRDPTVLPGGPRAGGAAAESVAATWQVVHGLRPGALPLGGDRGDPRRLVNEARAHLREGRTASVNIRGENRVCQW